MTIICIILLVVIAVIFWKKQSKQDTSAWEKLFEVISLKVTDYFCKGTPTKVVMFFLRGVFGLYEVSAFTYPTVRAGIECSKETGFWTLFLSFQFDVVSKELTYIFLVCITVVVVIYLIVYRNEDKIVEKINSLDFHIKDMSKKVDSAYNQELVTAGKVDIIIDKLDGVASSVVKHLLPNLKDSICSLKVNTANGYLDTIWKEIQINCKKDFALQSYILYLQGECARFISGEDSATFHKRAYEFMKKSGDEEEEILEGVIYEACKKGDFDKANKYIQELKNINPNNHWIYVVSLITSNDKNAIVRSLPADVDKDMVLACSIMFGRNEKYDSFIDIKSYEFQKTDNISIDNFFLWILDLSIATTRFCQNFIIQKEIKNMYTSEAKSLFAVTDKFLAALEKTEIENPVHDTLLLHAVTGYFSDQDSKWLDILKRIKPSSNIEELYYLSYSMILNDVGRYEESKGLLKQYKGSCLASILNMRFSLAIMNDDFPEWNEIFKDAGEANESIPDHFAHYYFACVNTLYDSVHDFVYNVRFDNQITNKAYSLFISFVKKEDVDTDFILQHKNDFPKTIAPYMSMVAKEKLSLSIAIEILEQCVDKKNLDVRSSLLIEYYQLDKSYGQKLYCLLKELRHAGQMSVQSLSLELQISTTIGDAENSLDITSELVKMLPDNESVWVNHVQSLLRCGNHTDEIIRLKSKFANLKHSAQSTKILFNIYHVINETKFALDLLYNEIIRTQNQELKDFYISIHLNQGVDKYISPEKDVVEVDDFVMLSVVGENKECTIAKSSIYEDLIGCKVGDKKIIKMKQDTEVEILAIHSKYFKLLRDIYKEIGENQSSRNIKMFSINDYNFQNDPIGALKKMTGLNEDDRTKERAMHEQYNNGEVLLLSFIDETEIVSDTYEKLFGSFMACSVPLAACAKYFVENKEWRERDIVLDITSLISLYEFDRKYGLKCDRKFILPKSITAIIKDQLVNEEKGCPKFFSKMVVERVGVDTIDEAKTVFWNKLKGLQDWIDAHCNVVTVEEIINYDISSNESLLLRIEMESVLLAKEGLLLSEDWSLCKRFISIFPILSTFNWLSLIEHDKAKDWGLFMLDCGNVGYPMTSSYICEQYNLMVSNKPNRYSICLENTKYYPWSVDSVINAAKSLFLGFIEPGKLAGVTNLIAVLFSHLDKQICLKIIRKEFLNSTDNLWRQCLMDALKISHPLILPENYI